MNRIFSWHDHQPRLGPASKRCCINTVRIGWAMPKLRARGDVQAYQWRCELPGLRETAANGECDTMEQAQSALEHIANRWFEIVDRQKIIA